MDICWQKTPVKSSRSIAWLGVFLFYTRLASFNLPVIKRPTEQNKIETQTKIPIIVESIRTFDILFDKRSAAFSSCLLINRRNLNVLYSAQHGPIIKKQSIVRTNAHVRWTGMSIGFNLTAFGGGFDVFIGGSFLWWCDFDWNRLAWSSFADNWFGGSCCIELKFSDCSVIYYFIIWPSIGENNQTRKKQK